MPLSFATILGGMITVIGTSTNILASGLSKQLGYGEFHLFQFTTLGLITFTIRLAYLAFIAPKLIPIRKAPSRNLEGYALKDYVTEVVVTPHSSLIGKTLNSTQLQHKFNIPLRHLTVL